ncbi:hypothetical protein M9R85_14300 [Psychrobacillus psychrodurans]|nr:hypothetical protein [Psychrobacillus psychrodurans]
MVKDPHSSMMGDSPDNFAINNDMQMSDVENLIVCGHHTNVGMLAYLAVEGMVEYLKKRRFYIFARNVLY